MRNEDMQDLVSKALRRAWQLGQTYWQQADSDFVSQHKKSDITQARFDELIEETRAAVATTPTAVLPEMDRWLMRDNHSFRKLPEDNAAALSVILSEFDAGYSHSSLFARDSSGRSIEDSVHCHGKRDVLETDARAWLERTHAKAAKDPTE